MWAFWARLIGWWRRRRWEKRDRAEKLRLRATPAYVGTLVGITSWRQEGGAPNWEQQTHRYDLYETPAGIRSYHFIRLAGPGSDPNGRDHMMHINVTAWIARKLEIDWETTRVKGGCWGWRK